MKKLQAAMRDNASKRWHESKLYYKVGSYFKGCHHCGDVVEETSDSGRMKAHYTSGYQVFRAYNPKWMGWTYWCYECGAKDLQAWAGAIDIGLPPIVGNRDAVRQGRADRRRDFIRNNKPEREVTERHAPSRDEQILALEVQVLKLMAMLQKK